MGAGIGKYVRHLIGALAGGMAAVVVSQLAGVGIQLDPETADALEQVTGGLLLAVSTVGYAWAEKYLKRFEWLDPEGAADRRALKEMAEEGIVP
jgi:hypothetical protein